MMPTLDEKNLQEQVTEIIEQMSQIKAQMGDFDARHDKMVDAVEFIEIMGKHNDDGGKVARWLLLTRIPKVRSMTLTEIIAAVKLENCKPTKMADMLIGMGFELKIAKYPEAEEQSNE